MAQVSNKDRFEENLITLREEAGQPDESAVLTAVKKREIELKTELLLVRQKAEDIISTARSKAAAIKAQAAESGREKGAKLVNEEMEAAQAQAAKITEATAGAAATLSARGEKNFEQAVEFVIKTVLPGIEAIDHAAQDDKS